MADPLRVSEDKHLPTWVWLVVGFLVVVGALAVVRWVLGLFFNALGLVLLGLVLYAAFLIIRGAWRSRR